MKVGSDAVGRVRHFVARRIRRREPQVRFDVKHPGELTDSGYHVGQSEEARHASLEKAVRKHGSREVIMALARLGTWNRRKIPEITARAKADEQFVREWSANHRGLD